MWINSRDQMEVIAHQAIGMALPTGLLRSLGQRLEEIVPVHLVEISSRRSPRLITW